MSLSVEEIKSAVFETAEQESFLLRDIVEKIKTKYPDEEVNSQPIRAYLQRIEAYGLVEESRSGYGLDKRYWWNNPFKAE
ncbi:MAG: hypothetical protein NTZ13_03395 [Candidatus Parcubacteria bacterium]|nr:hypothetical protein [Candidatus Parcubacteria bacterium]